MYEQILSFSFLLAQMLVFLYVKLTIKVVVLAVCGAPEQWHSSLKESLESHLRATSARFVVSRDRVVDWLSSGSQVALQPLDFTYCNGALNGSRTTTNLQTRVSFKP